MKTIKVFACALLVAFTAIFALEAATITSLTTLPDIQGGVFTAANASTLITDIAAANTNFTNLNNAGAIIVDCATTAACPNTLGAALHTVIIRGTLATGSPSTYAVTAISPAFTGATTYACVAQDTTTIANNIGVLTAGYVSGSAVTFTGPNTNTDTFRGVCTGY